MNFSSALEALKAGKKIRLSDMNAGVYIIIRNVPGEDHKIWIIDPAVRRPIEFYFYDEALLSDDWEIIEDIPEVKLQRSTDTYFKCPKCGAQWEVVVYSEDIINNENIRECCKCGQEVKIVNLGEFNKGLHNEGTLSKYKTWLQHMIEISDQDLLTYVEENNFIKAGKYEIRKDVFKECLDMLNDIK